MCLDRANNALGQSSDDSKWEAYWLKGIVSACSIPTVLTVQKLTTERGSTVGLCCMWPKGQGHKWPKILDRHKRVGVWGNQKYLVAKGCPDIWRALPAGLRRQPSTELFLIVSMPSNKSWGNISHDSGNQKAIIWVTNCVWKTPVMNTAHNSFMWANLSTSTEIQKASCTQEQNSHPAKVQEAPSIQFRCELFSPRL